MRASSACLFQYVASSPTGILRRKHMHSIAVSNVAYPRVELIRPFSASTPMRAICTLLLATLRGQR